MTPELSALLELARGYKMAPDEKRAQAIDWAVGNVLVDHPEYDEWTLRLAAAKAHDAKERP